MGITSANAGWFSVGKSDAVITKDQAQKFITVNPLDLSDVADCEQLNEKIIKAFSAAGSNYSDTIEYLNGDSQSVASETYAVDYQGLRLMDRYLSKLYGSSNYISDSISKAIVNGMLGNGAYADGQHRQAIDTQSFQNCTGSKTHRLYIAYHKAYNNAVTLQDQTWGADFKKLYIFHSRNRDVYIDRFLKSNYGQDSIISYDGLLSTPREGELSDSRIQTTLDQLTAYKADLKKRKEIQQREYEKKQAEALKAEKLLDARLDREIAAEDAAQAAKDAAQAAAKAEVQRKKVERLNHLNKIARHLILLANQNDFGLLDGVYLNDSESVSVYRILQNQGDKMNCEIGAFGEAYATKKFAQGSLDYRQSYQLNLKIENYCLDLVKRYKK